MQDSYITKIHYTQTDIFQKFISLNFYDYGLQSMKTQTLVFQKINITFLKTLNQVLVLLKNAPDPGKRNQYLHKALQEEAWSALKCLGRRLYRLGADKTVHQQMTWLLKPSLTVRAFTGAPAAWTLCISSLLPDSGTWSSQ